MISSGASRLVLWENATAAWQAASDEGRGAPSLLTAAVAAGQFLTVRLDTEPLSTVTVACSGGGVVVCLPARATFDFSTFSAPVTFAVVAAADDVDRGDRVR